MNRDSRGHRQWTPAQLARRRHAALELALHGWGVMQIAQALDAHPSSVSTDLSVMWPDRPMHAYNRREGIPPLIDWQSEPAAPGPAEGMVLRSISMLMRELKGGNYRNSFAHAVTEAAGMNSQDWLTRARMQVAELGEACSHLQRILDDPKYRNRMAVTAEGRDDLQRK